jgi:hypothetical protein
MFGPQAHSYTSALWRLLVHVRVSRFSIIVDSTLGPGAIIEATLQSSCPLDVSCDIHGCLKSNIINIFISPNVWSC